MAYWIVTKKTQLSEDISAPYMVHGKPGSGKWHYSLKHIKTQQTITAVGSCELEVGMQVHESDISKVS